MHKRRAWMIAVFLSSYSILWSDDQPVKRPAVANGPVGVPSTEIAKTSQKRSVDRGFDVVSNMSSPLGALARSYSNLWRQWGIKEKPSDYQKALNERYGLVPTADPDGRFPVGLKKIQTPLGEGVGQTCLLCHSGQIAGQLVIGLGNASLDFQSLLEDFEAESFVKLGVPFELSSGRGVINAMSGTIFLLQFRNPDLSFRNLTKMTTGTDLNHDIPAWWNRRYKKTMYHTGSTSSQSVRSNMSFLLAPTNSAEFIKAQEPNFRDARDFIMTLKAPRYPFEIDREKAKRGELVFNNNCSECHGTYGKKAHYPNRIIPVDEVGTDARLAKFSVTETDLDYYRKSWFYVEFDDDGNSMHMLNHGGYQAPPLYGIWATAPYFHNASVPTIGHVLNSKDRPAICTRTFRTDRGAYDQKLVGWKTTNVLPNDLAKMSKWQRRRVTDTRRAGRGNQGHTFGDHLEADERTDLLEYLKTL